MADILNSIKQGLDEAGKNIGNVATGITSKAGEAAGAAGEFISDVRDKSGEAIHNAGNGLSEIVKNITHGDEEDGEAKELDEYEVAIIEYNQTYTFMSDNGLQLHQERERSEDLLTFVETLINSIANSPKEFNAAFEEIREEKKEFTAAAQYAKDELDAARHSAMSAGGGIAAGAAVASMAPSAAIWIATTFGTASTGTAISTLSGAAASQAALAWLGGGALAAGGAGTAGGSALLALAGPIGWGIAGATLLTSIILFARNSFKLKKQKQEELMDIKSNTERVAEMNSKIESLLHKTAELREQLANSMKEALSLYGSDYPELEEGDQKKLGALVNNSKSLAQLMIKDVE